MAGQAHFEYYEVERHVDAGPDEMRVEFEWRWRLRAANGEIVASGEGYPSKEGVLAGIAAVQRAAIQSLGELEHDTGDPDIALEEAIARGVGIEEVEA